MDFSNVLLLLFVGVIVVAIGAATGKGKGKSKVKYQFKEQALMTPTEIQFFRFLEHTLPEFHVFPQVSMGAVLQPVKKHQGKEKMGAMGTIGQKRLDYVLCNRDSMDVFAVVELDDKYHDSASAQARDKARDKHLTCAGIVVHRFDCRQIPGANELRACLGIINENENNSGAEPFFISPDAAQPEKPTDAVVA